MHAPGPHIRLMAYDSNSALPAGPISWGFYSGGRDRRTFRNIHQDTRWMCSCERVTENASNLWASSKHPRHPFLDWFGINRHMLLDEEIFCTLLTLQCPSHSFHFLDTILDIIPVVHVVFFCWRCTMAPTALSLTLPVVPHCFALLTKHCTPAASWSLDSYALPSPEPP